MMIFMRIGTSSVSVDSHPLMFPGWEEAVFLWLESGEAHPKSRAASRDLRADHSRRFGCLHSRPATIRPCLTTGSAFDTTL